MFPTWRRGVRFLFVFLALAINVAFGTASAIDRPHRLAELQHIALTSRDGAPADAAAIAQTKDGYLWVGAASGLYRFDGINFERMTSLGGQSIADQPVIKLFTDREDGLWIGFGGYGAGYFKEGRYRAFGRDVGIRVMSEGLADMDGVVWLVVNGRLARFIDGAIKPLGDEWNFPSGRIVDMRLGATGTLWVGVNSDAATPYLPRGGTKFQRAPPQFHAANLGIARDGTIWGASDGRLQMLTLRDGIPDEVVSISKEAFGIMTFDRSGGLWIEGSRGLMHVADPAKLRSPPGDQLLLTEAMDSRSGLLSNAIWSLFEDREGNVWVAGSSGLERFRETLFTPVKLRERALGFAMAAGVDGSIWAANWSGGLLHLGAQGVHDFESVGPRISALHRSADGDLWVGASGGLWKSVGDERFVPIALPDELKSYPITALTTDANQALWVGGGPTSRLRDGTWDRPGTAEGFPERWSARTMLTSTDGRLFFGVGNDVLVYDGRIAKRFDEVSGLSIGAINAFAQRGPHIWVAGAGGIALFDGDRFHRLKGANREKFVQIGGIVETSDGELWIHGLNEAWRVDRHELQAALPTLDREVRTSRFDQNDGLYGSATTADPRPTLVEATDGKLWFATNAGLSWFEPAKPNLISPPPQVSIRSIHADGIPIADAPSIEIPPRNERLEIGYAATAMSVPERIHFRYRLEHVDQDWQEVGLRRTAFYNRVAPGDYNFLVQSTDESGAWSSQVAKLSFRVAPAWFQMLWFKALVAIVLLFTAWFLYRLRIKAITGQLQNEARIRLAERERIARELHDTLLQATQGLIFTMQAVTARLSHEGAVRGMLEQSLDRANSVMAEGRDRIQELRAAGPSNENLAEALARVGDELAQDRPTFFKTMVDGQARHLASEAMEEILRIGREALINAFQHAEASAVEVQIIYQADALCVRVRDDGKGIDEASLKTGSRADHWGLPGMKERAHRLGGELNIWSRAGAGTELALKVPAAVAYKEQARIPRWLARWRPFGGGDSDGPLIS